MNEANKKILTVREVARILRLSEVRVRQFCQEGRLGQKIGGRYIIFADQAHEFAKETRPRGVRRTKFSK